MQGAATVFRRRGPACMPALLLPVSAFYVSESEGIKRRTTAAPANTKGAMSVKIVTVFGGSGFIGRHLVRHLARNGWRVRVAVRDVARAGFLKPAGDLGQIPLVPVSVTDPVGVAAAVQGADAVVNLVGIL